MPNVNRFFDYDNDNDWFRVSLVCESVLLPQHLLDDGLNRRILHQSLEARVGA